MQPDDKPSSLASDPLLSAFLSPTFSPTTYLNSTLSPLAISSSANPTADHGPLSLAAVHSKATSQLSTIDVHLNRLQATLTNLTDDILRATPRLGYEVEVLRSDVFGLAETLTSPSTMKLLEGLLDDDLNCGSGDDSKDNLDKKKVIKEASKGKPEVLTKLETLVKVRSHLEEVIRIFGNAMEWTLPEATQPTPTNTLSTYAPPSRSTTPVPNTKATGSAKIEQEISYLLANNEITKATARVEELDKLSSVWKNTTEYPARVKFVEGLKWRIIEAGKGEEEVYEEERDSQGDTNGAGYGIPGVTDAGREGYYGLINQFQRMRGNVMKDIA